MLYDIITFDCYGTLVDWEEGISRSMIAAASRDGVAVDPAQVIDAHAKIEPEVQAGKYRSYREVLIETAVRMAPLLRWELDRERAGLIPDELSDWPPFADTNEALERLRDSGCRLGILSNIDDELLAGTLRRLTVDFDLVVTAQQVRSYKPAHAHFAAARESIGDDRWLHAAQSYFHDVVPARELGIPVAWVNRKRERPAGEARPDLEVTTLTGLADELTGTV